MVINLYGSDSYRRNRKLKEYIDRYQVKYGGLSRSSFYLDNGDLDKLEEFVKSNSLFETFRFGVIFGANSLEGKELKKFIEIIKNNSVPKDLTLVVVSDKKPTKDFGILLKPPVVSEEFSELPFSEFKKFIESEAEKRKIKLDRESLDLLAQFYKGDTWGVITELDKLALLDPVRSRPAEGSATATSGRPASNGVNDNKVSRKILEKHMNISLPLNIFGVLDQFNIGGVGERLGLLEELFFDGADAGMVFNFLAIMVSGERDKKRMADYDAAVKSGKLEYEEALLDFAIL